jgi:hypothetical protein
MPRGLILLLAALLSVVPRTQAAQSSSALDTLYTQYTHGDPDVITRTLTTAAAYAAIQTDLVARLPQWQRDWHPSEVTFALEVAIAAFSHDWPDAMTLLLGARDLVAARPDPVGAVAAMDRFETRFHECAVALLVTLRPGMAETYLTSISARLGTAANPVAPRALVDPRLALARAVLNEKRAPRTPTAGTGKEPITWRLQPND